MTRTVNAKVTRPAEQTAVAGGRVFTISLKNIPRVNAQSRARLEAAARSPANLRRDYPQFNTD